MTRGASEQVAPEGEHSDPVFVYLLMQTGAKGTRRVSPPDRFVLMQTRVEGPIHISSSDSGKRVQAEEDVIQIDTSGPDEPMQQDPPAGPTVAVGVAPSKRGKRGTRRTEYRRSSKCIYSNVWGSANSGIGTADATAAHSPILPAWSQSTVGTPAVSNA